MMKIVPNFGKDIYNEERFNYYNEYLKLYDFHIVYKKDKYVSIYDNLNIITFVYYLHIFDILNLNLKDIDIFNTDEGFVNYLKNQISILYQNYGLVYGDLSDKELERLNTLYECTQSYKGYIRKEKILKILNKYMEKDEIISDILRLELIITNANCAGHRAIDGDIYHEMRLRVTELREKLKNYEKR